MLQLISILINPTMTWIIWEPLSAQCLLLFGALYQARIYDEPVENKEAVNLLDIAGLSYPSDISTSILASYFTPTV